VALTLVVGLAVVVVVVVVERALFKKFDRFKGLVLLLPNRGRFGLSVSSSIVVEGVGVVVVDVVVDVVVVVVVVDVDKVVGCNVVAIENDSKAFAGLPKESNCSLGKFS
jgi:hypothetical protein